MSQGVAIQRRRGDAELDKSSGDGGLEVDEEIYIWRLNGEGSGEEGNGHSATLILWAWASGSSRSARMKVDQELQEDKADYLFHQFDFQQLKTSTDVDENENMNQLSKDQDNRATPETVRG
jgi:hypothetical protein